MKIYAIMMCKNEDDLVIPWTLYHGKLLGFGSLYIFDNGSTHPKSIDSLLQAESLGANIRRDKYHPDHYVYKGNIFAELIKQLDKEAPADFYFPLDCDEFICSETSPYQLEFTLSAIKKSLRPFLNHKGALMIQAAYDNSPKRISAFLRSSSQRKTFFAQGACRSLDHGFHCGEGVAQELRSKTDIAYLHFHFKPFSQLIFHARQKIRPFLPGGDLNSLDSGREGLLKYLEERRPGYHLISHLLFADEADYIDKFNDHAWVEMPSVMQVFRESGTTIPFQSETNRVTRQ